jgi:hypothetical protein
MKKIVTVVEDKQQKENSRRPRNNTKSMTIPTATQIISSRRFFPDFPRLPYSKNCFPGSLSRSESTGDGTRLPKCQKHRQDISIGFTPLARG